MLRRHSIGVRRYAVIATEIGAEQSGDKNDREYS
jgi:hypothetical protein